MELKRDSCIKIAIASGKGGTGKTFVSVNLFNALKKADYSVTLVDCDAEEPNVMVFFKAKLVEASDVFQKLPVIDESNCTYCSKCHDYCNYNAIFILPPHKIIKVLNELCHGCGACLAACSFDAVTEVDVSQGIVSRFSVDGTSEIIEARMKTGVYSPVRVIKEAIKMAVNTKVVLMDSPPGTSCPFIHTVNTADYVILVTEPTPFGLSDLKQSVATLASMNKTCGVIVNRAGIGNRDVYKYLKDNDIELLMEIPYDRDISYHYSKGEIIGNSDVFALEDKLIYMFDKIVREYGNSSNQW